MSFALRAYTWHKYRVWIDIQALQISLLAGRIFFKGLRYHGENETVLVQNGYITWRYWQRTSRQVDLSSDQVKDDSIPKEKPNQDTDLEDVSDTPTPDQEVGNANTLRSAGARIAIHASGLEWFIYNRTPVYNSILDQATSHQTKPDDHKTHPKLFHQKARHRRPRSARPNSKATSTSETSADSATKDLAPGELPVPISRLDTYTSADSDQDEQSSAAVSAFYAIILRVLPISLDCTKGAITLGNENTRAIVVTTFASASGHIDAGAAGVSDIFRQVFDFEIERPKVEMRPNPDYRRSQTTTAEKFISAAESMRRHRKRWWYVDFGLRPRLQRIAQSFKRLIPGLRSSRGSLRTSSSPERNSRGQFLFEGLEDDNRSWHGLGRYLDEDERDDHEGWSHVDYARYSQILDSPAIHLNFYWDTPGEVSEDHFEQQHTSNHQDINGPTAPAYGMDLTVKGGVVNYGPWADRLRVEIQNVFLPNPFRSVSPAEPLSVGQSRQSTLMAIRVDLEDEVSLRVPTRERSKDWLWRGRAHAVREAAAGRKQREKKHFRFRKSQKTTLGPDVRPFGWLTVSAGKDSTVSYDMDLVPRHQGYTNKLRLELKDTKASSSVNHALLWRCESQKVSCDLSNPLVWNSPHTWVFDIENNVMEMFLLRDHMFLLTDLIGDFTAGLKSDYMTFVPYLYELRLTFPDLKLYLNANDYNIIDNPCDLEENAFLILGFQQLNGKVDIPMLNFAPRQSSVKFLADGQSAYLDLVTPVWNTLNTLTEDKTMATLKRLDLEGSYNYFSGVSPRLTDSLFMSINGHAPEFFLHGYLIRYFMNVKENYFGDHLHFRTLEEYQDMLAGNDVDAPRPGLKKENDLDVILTVRADTSSVLLPANIYARRECLRVDVLLIEADMRFTNYYMDLQVNSSPLEASIQSISAKGPEGPAQITNCQLFVDSTGIYGHRLFGAPPTEPTYVCNWDIDVGNVTGECSTHFVQTMINAIIAFVHTLDDDENALPEFRKSTINDVTFLRVNLAALRLWLVTNSAAFLLDLSETDLSFSDWAGTNFAETLRAHIPRILMAAVDRTSANRHHTQPSSEVKTFARFETSLMIGSLNKTANLSETRSLQQQHIRYHDQRTLRTQWLLTSSSRYPLNHKTPDWARDPPATPAPAMPEPMGTTGKPQGDTHDRRHPRRKSSFLASELSVHRDVSSHKPQVNSVRPSHDGPQGLEEGTLAPLQPNNSRHNSANGKTTTDQHKISLKTITFSSPWTAPHFTLHNVHPDSSSMPEASVATSRDVKPLALQTSDQYESNRGASGEGSRDSVLCFIENGLLGYCTPELFTSLGELIRELTKDQPIDQLDKIQIAVMKKLLDTFRHDDHGHVIDLAVRLPIAHIRLINISQGTLESRPHDDRYDVKLSGTKIMFRSQHLKNDDRVRNGIRQNQVAYGSIESFSMIAGADNAGSRKPAAQAEMSFANTGFWFSMREELRSKLQLSNFDLVIWAERLANMAGLIQRTLSMIEGITAAFTGLDQRSKPKHLIYHLTQAGSLVSDPVFLTRPSYVLRSADKHVRLTDSWKIISRLRHIYTVLEKQHGPSSLEKCGCRTMDIEGQAKQDILSVFEKWRGWDFARDKVPLMNAIFDDLAAPATITSQSRLKVSTEVVIGKLGIVLDPGPRQSDLTLLGLDLNVCLGPATTAETHARPAQNIAIQAYLADIALHLNWALIDLARQVIELGNPLVKTRSAVSSGEQINFEEGMLERHFTVVIGTDAASVDLSSANLKIRWVAENYRSATSFDLGNLRPSVMSFTVTANTAMARFKSHSRTLLMWGLRSPKLYGSISPQSSDTERTVIRVCAASNKFRFEMKEHVVGLLKVADSVVDTELRSILALVDHLSRDTDSTEVRNTKQPPTKAGLDFDLHVAMFMDDYRLRFTIVPSLQYSIAGHVARTSILPRQRGGLTINFDIKQHEHSFEVPRGVSKNSLSILKMPPINGRLRLHQTAKVICVRASTAVEQINLETAGVRACFDALNQPGVIQLLPDAKLAVDELQATIAEVLGAKSDSRRSTTVGSSSLLRYSLHGTLAGVNIHMSTPPVQGSNLSRAELELRLDSTTLFIHNESTDNDSIFEQPQFTLDSKGIGLSAYRSTEHNKVNVGKCIVGLRASSKTETYPNSANVQVFRAWSDGVSVELYEETSAAAADIVAFIQDRIKSIKVADKSNNINNLRRMTTAGITERLKPKEHTETVLETVSSKESTPSTLYDATYALDLENIMIRWNLTKHSLLSPTRELEDLVFSVRKVDLQTRQEGTARLSILDTQLQIVPQSQSDQPTQRTANSALLPEVVFGSAYLSTKKDRRFAFQAKGKALDLRLASDSVIPAHALQKSLAKASAELRKSSTTGTNDSSAEFAQSPDTAPSPRPEKPDLLGGKRLASLLVDADFAGAVVNISPRLEAKQQTSVFGFLKGKKRSRAGRYGQAVQGDGATSVVLQSPGVALKIEYEDDGQEDPSLSTEVKVAASSNTLYPTVVPLILEISSSIKEILGDDDETKEVPQPQPQASSYLTDSAISNSTPTAILGRCKLNAGLYIQRQEFSLSCQPIARVAATARFADIFVAVNTVSAPDQERFFAILTTFNKLEASVQHVYSRESTASFEVESIVLSLMNSKHVSSTTGISTILKVSPMKTDINAKQLQDFLLFREIWYPAELRRAPKTSAPLATTQDQQAYAMQRYQELSGKGALPWHAIVSVQEIKLQVDLGQSLGKSAFTISKLWASSKKNNDSEQNLCIGFERVGIDSTGRMSGFVELQNMKARTSIRWPADGEIQSRAPLIQASIAFEHLRVKAAFDYQPFAIADISSFEILMYNVRHEKERSNDRLVGILDGGKVQAFCTTAAAGQILALVQAFERLIQEKQEAYETSLQDLDKFLRRKSVFPSSSWVAPLPSSTVVEKPASKSTFSLHTDVVVTINVLDIGAFPNTFFDNQILKVEATEVQARFAVATNAQKIHTRLGMSLGQVRVALSNINRVTTKALSEVSVPDVIERATTSRGGTIVKVPRLVSSMETWQAPNSNVIEHNFRSTFEGKVDVGWNFSRINFIRGMWQSHSRALAQRLGKPLAPSAVKIMAEPQGGGEHGGQEKITAVVNVPQSRFTYVALTPPVIDTPQLRDMGEATPPLEWIGLHRDKLPEATHSIAIVSLLEVAKEVEDAYTRILGAS